MNLETPLDAGKDWPFETDRCASAMLWPVRQCAMRTLPVLYGSNPDKAKPPHLELPSGFAQAIILPRAQRKRSS